MLRASVATPAAVVELPKAAQQPAAQADTQLADSAELASTVTDEPAAESAGSGGEETVTVVVPDSVETFTESLPAEDTTTETSEPALTSAEQDEILGDGLDAGVEPDGLPSDTAEIVEAAGPEMEALQALESSVGTAETQRMKAIDSEPAADSAMWDDEVPDDGEHNAYEEYLKDSDEPMHLYAPATKDEPEDVPAPEPVAKVDASGELQIEMDTKNAHVWNELGNVYFNTSAFDDSIVAYSKAIELDRWFAWPYSNLALAYVQKRRFVEAILLYQRSIELFTSDKDKAISWNRLGNVYRRLNDYENAIAAYQRADALDPDNATLSLQSRFSLLGNYAMDQKASYAS